MSNGARELRIAFGPDAHLGLAADATKKPVEALLWGMGETLTRVTPEGTVEPWLAEDVSYVDPLTWRVKLRDNAYFWDGTRVAATDVAESFKVNWSTQIATDFMLSKQTKVHVIDERTLDFTTPEPTGGLPYALAYHQLIVHKGHGLTMTGAYRPAALYPDRNMVLEHFDGHWRGRAGIDRITVTYIADPGERIAQLKNGEVDLLYGLQPEALSQIGDGFVVQTAITNRVHYLQFNLARPPLDDAVVREAAALAVDREVLLKDVLGGYGEVAHGFFPENAGVRAVAIQTTDVDRARRLLDEAGWVVGGDGVRAKTGKRLAFTLFSFPQRAEMTRLAHALRDQLAEVGFDVTVEEVPNIGVRTAGRDFDSAMRSINTLISGDPYFLLAITLSQQGRENTGGYYNPEIERLLAAMKQERDPVRRQDLSGRIQEALRTGTPNVYLLVAPLIAVARAGKLKGTFAGSLAQYFISPELEVSQP